MKIEIKGLDSLKRAFDRNPMVVKEESGKFMARAKAEYMRVILRNPWKLGHRGGGVPVDTGNLRDTHRTVVKDFSMLIKPEPSRQSPNYADFVHEGTRKLKGRPWLDFAIEKKKNVVDTLLNEMLENITKKLAS